MKKIPLSFLLILSAALPIRAAEPTKGFFFKNGDRVLFLGDSITEQYEYSSYIELYLTTRFPQWRLSFLNAGIGGDRAVGGNARFVEHVLKEKPTAVTINFGMNDFGYRAFDAKLQREYLANTEAMLKKAKEAGLRIALLSPNTVEFRYARQPAPPRLGLDTRLTDSQKQFYAPLKDLAARHGVPFVDQYAVTRAVIEKLDSEKANDVKPFPDTVHTGPAGGLLMAHTILAGLHAPAQVSHVDIGIAPGVRAKSGCIISNVQASSTGVSFERTDAALPLPVQQAWLPILPYVDNLKDLNWYGLQVRGLADGKYTLHIDGHETGSFSSQQLAEGVNLGNLTAGHVFDQANKAFNAINEKNKLVHARFRKVVMFALPEWDKAAVRKLKDAELAKRMKEIEAKQAEIYQLVQPVKRRFELKLNQG